MLKSASAVSVNKFQLFTEKENIKKGGTLIYAYPLFLAQRMICEMKKQRWSSTRGREYINSKVLLMTDEAFCDFHENGLDV